MSAQSTSLSVASRRSQRWEPKETGAACDEYPLDDRHGNTLCFTGNAFI